MLHHTVHFAICVCLSHKGTRQQFHQQGRCPTLAASTLSLRLLAGRSQELQTRRALQMGGG